MESWISEDCFRAPHPLDRSLSIYIWHCMTHLQKSMRNALCNSGANGSRQFKDIFDVPFGWATVKALFANDQRFVRKKTVLSEDAVILSGWSKMNVALSKAPFEDNTLSQLYISICQAVQLTSNSRNLYHRQQRSQRSQMPQERNHQRQRP
jgi:hypothetical protein